MTLLWIAGVVVGVPLIVGGLIETSSAWQRRAQRHLVRRRVDAVLAELRRTA